MPECSIVDASHSQRKPQLYNDPMVSVTPNNPDEQQPTIRDSMGNFTPESASKLLPLVESIVREMCELSQKMDFHREQVSGLNDLRQTIDGDAYEDEVEDVRRSFSELEAQFNACHKELLSLGVKTHDPFDGAVDFPAELDRRRVNLCWLPGEKAVTHWHEVHEQSKDRKRLDGIVVSGAAV